MGAKDTIVALATGWEPSALALLRLSGSLCEAILGSELIPRKASVIRYKSLDGKELDECVAVFYPEGASFTGEPSLELCLHGNPLIVQGVFDDLLARGCRVAEPGEFTRRAFLAGRMDLSEAEAVAEVIHAESEAALEAAQYQLRGALSRQVNRFCEQAVGLLAEVEASIDFPEDDLPEADLRALGGKVELLREAVDVLAGGHEARRRLQQEREVVLLGATNAGKSCLLNALLGEGRALVSAEPATTRDSISEHLHLGGFKLRLTDTAGWGVEGSAVNQMGVERSEQVAQTAQGILWVIDGSVVDAETEWPDCLESFAQRGCLAFVFNKVDLPLLTRDVEVFPEAPRLFVSAKTGERLADLRDFLAEWCVEKPPVDTVWVNARSADALQRASVALGRAEGELERASLECAAVEIRQCLDALGEIVGKVDDEALLDTLFGQFCIGK